MSFQKSASDQTQSRKCESGNILIYILGAIVLIGILVTLVKGSSTPGAGIDREALEIRIAEVQAYGNELERAVAYILRSGYSESDIRFAHPNHASAYGDITDDPARQIFKREGGGATWRDNPDDVQVTNTDFLINRANRIPEVGTTGGALSSNELIIFLPYVTANFCTTLNDKLGIDNDGTDDPPDDIGSADITDMWDGTAPPSAQINGTAFDGVIEGCFEGGGTPPANSYHYYRVLLAR